MKNFGQTAEVFHLRHQRRTRKPQNDDWEFGLGMHLFRQAERETLRVRSVVKTSGKKLSGIGAAKAGINVKPAADSVDPVGEFIHLPFCTARRRAQDSRIVSKRRRHDRVKAIAGIRRDKNPVKVSIPKLVNSEVVPSRRTVEVWHRGHKDAHLGLGLKWVCLSVTHPGDRPFGPRKKSEADGCSRSQHAWWCQHKAYKRGFVFDSKCVFSRRVRYSMVVKELKGEPVFHLEKTSRRLFRREWVIWHILRIQSTKARANEASVKKELKNLWIRLIKRVNSQKVARAERPRASDRILQIRSWGKYLDWLSKSSKKASGHNALTAK